MKRYSLASHGGNKRASSYDIIKFTKADIYTPRWMLKMLRTAFICPQSAIVDELETTRHVNLKVRKEMYLFSPAGDEAAFGERGRIGYLIGPFLDVDSS